MGGEADHADGATAVPAGRIDEALAKAAFLGALETYSQKFGTFFLAKLLGLDIGFTEHSCVVEMEVHDYMFNPQGSLHGGVISTILDISMGHLLNHKAGPGATLERCVAVVSAAKLPSSNRAGPSATSKPGWSMTNSVRSRSELRPGSCYGIAKRPPLDESGSEHRSL